MQQNITPIEVLKHIPTLESVFFNINAEQHRIIEALLEEDPYLGEMLIAALSHNLLVMQTEGTLQ